MMSDTQENNRPRWNILMVHNRYQIPGGEDTVFENEARLLAEHGHTVIRYERNNSEFNAMNPVQKIFAMCGTIYSFRTEREIRRLIRENHIDIVHVHNTQLLISSSVYDAALKEHVPVIQTIHNFRMICLNGLCYRDGKICQDCLGKGISQAVKHRCYRGSLAQTILVAAAMQFNRMRGIYRKISYITLTAFNADMLLKQGQISMRQIFIKPNFTDHTGTVIPYEKRRDQIIFAGRLDESKGIRFLLDVAQRKKDQTFVIYGGGPLMEECEQTVKNKNLSNVLLMGPKDHETVMKEIAVSKAMILPTRWYEGFPMSIAEALAAGTPVIVPDLGNAGDLVQEGKSGYHYIPDDVESCCLALSKDMNLNDSAYAQYCSTCTREITYGKLMEIYEAISGKKQQENYDANQ